MGWRIVKQPNGLYARFSEIVDDFTDMNMTLDEAFFCCRMYCGIEESNQKINNAIRELDSNGRTGQELGRWHHAISIIRAIHGRPTARKRMRIGENAGSSHPITADKLPVVPMILELPPSDSRHKTEDSGGAW